MKKIAILLILPFLFACNVKGETTELSSNGSDITSIVSTSNSDVSSVVSSSAEEKEIIFEKDFSGYENDSLPFFNEGYSTVNSKFGDNYLNLIDFDGYIRTCEIADLAGDIEIRLASHLTNLNNLNETAVGKTFTLSVAAVDFNIETFEYKTISEEIFSYTLTEEDVKNQSVPGVPAYSKDFSNGYMSFNLNGDGANRILITMKSKIEFTANEKKAGVNYSVHSLQILR